MPATTMMALYLQSSAHGLKVFALLVAAFFFFNWNDAPATAGPVSPHDAIMIPSKALVMSSSTRSDLWWLPESPPNWYHFVYVVDDPWAPLTVPENKGDEAMVYLTYIIDNYYSLPETVLFHTDDDSLYQLPMSARYELSHLQEDTVQKHGFVHMRCERSCDYNYYLANDTLDISQIAWAETGVQFSMLLREMLGPEYVLPERITAPYGGQFAVSRKAIHARPLAFWTKLRDWILETNLDNDTCDMLMEFTWHIWFGLDAEYCVDYRQCLCDTVGVDTLGQTCQPLTRW